MCQICSQTQRAVRLQQSRGPGWKEENSREDQAGRPIAPGPSSCAGAIAIEDSGAAGVLVAGWLPAGRADLVPLEWQGTYPCIADEGAEAQGAPDESKVAVSIDSDTRPYHVLQIRGTARTETVEGVSPEYEASARRYLGDEPARALVDQVKGTSTHMSRISVKPEWVAVIDFETRFPSAMSG